MQEDIRTLQKMIDHADNIVFFSGAGVSTDSGLKDFRSKDGLYQKKYPYPVEYMLSSEMFFAHPEEFYQFYKENLNSLGAEPNVVHRYLKKLEEKGKLKAIITQNIDGLHTLAGCKNVYEIHGTVYQNHCLNCHKEYDGKFVFESDGVPKCSCGGILKPDVVLYGEALPKEAVWNSMQALERADLLVVAGTSLTVEPASSMVRSFRGGRLVIINRDKTPYDGLADLVIHGNLKDVFENLE